MINLIHLNYVFSLQLTQVFNSFLYNIDFLSLSKQNFTKKKLKKQFHQPLKLIVLPELFTELLPFHFPQYSLGKKKKSTMIHKPKYGKFCGCICMLRQMGMLHKACTSQKNSYCTLQ